MSCLLGREVRFHQNSLLPLVEKWGGGAGVGRWGRITTNRDIRSRVRLCGGDRRKAEGN